MKAEYNLQKNEETRFGNLKSGDTFLDRTEFEDDVVLMVIELAHGLGDGDGFDGYALALDDGSIIGYRNSEPVVKIEAKIVVTKIYEGD